MNFINKLTGAARNNNSLLCIGLDPDPELMPENISVSEFNREITDATSDLVCAYKPNFAFYEALGAEGLDALKQTVRQIPGDIPVIGDAKRGDIGNTARAYARALFDYLGGDAVTVNPYLGFDSVEPFIQYRDKGVFILCRTSNAGALDFQSLRCQTESLPDAEPEHGQRPLFEIVALKARQWNQHGNIGLVVGATYPKELKLIRSAHPNMPILIPGIGAQGGSLEAAMATSTPEVPNIINVSRGILYAGEGALDDILVAIEKYNSDISQLVGNHDI